MLIQENVDALCRSYGEDDETSYQIEAEFPAFVATHVRVLGTPVPQGTLHWSTQIAEFVREIIFCKIKEKSNGYVCIYNKGEGIRVRKRTGCVWFLVLLRLWT